MGCTDDTLKMKKYHIWLLALPLALAVILSFLIPYGASFREAAANIDRITIRQNSSLLHITLFTLKQAFFSVLVALVLGLPGAWFIGTSRSRFTPLLRSFTAVPFAMPSILVVLGFVLFFGNSGWLSHIFPIKILYKPEAIILAHGFFNFPLVIRLAGDGLARARKAYAPAAASLGASHFVTVLTVILPLSLPAIMSAALLVFLYSFTSFAVVLVLGGGPASTTLAVEIYRHARIFLNFPNAGALAFIETLIAVSVFLGFAYFGKKSADIKTDLQERVIDERKKSLPVLIFMSVYALIAAIFILGPIVSIIVESFLYRPSRSASQLPGFIWWLSLGSTALPALLRSLVLAFSSATLACVLAVFGAGYLKLQENRGRAHYLTSIILRFMAAAPIISSGIVLGLGWLIIYGNNFSRSPLALIILHAVIALPFAFNSVSEGFRSLPANTINAAMVFGADPFKALLTAAVPLSLKRIRSGWGFAAALSLGELNAVMMLGMEGWETLPLFIYRAVGAYRYGIACAAGTLLILCCAACFLLAEGSLKNTGKKYGT
jgi:thiamine transport system permease protein